MLKKLFSFLDNKKEEKRINLLKELPGNKTLTLLIAHNKELTDIKPFLKLLTYFDIYKIEGHYLQQNINPNIIAFKKNIYETCFCLEKIKKNLNSKNLNEVNIVSRVAKNKYSSYTFFNDKANDTLNYFDQKTLDQLVLWMKDILIFFDENKTSQESYEEAFCSVTYRNLDAYFTFFYCLICQIKNIRYVSEQTFTITLEEDL